LHIGEENASFLGIQRDIGLFWNSMQMIEDKRYSENLFCLHLDTFGNHVQPVQICS